MATVDEDVLPYETKPAGPVSRVLFRLFCLLIVLGLIHVLAQGGVEVRTGDGLEIGGVALEESAEVEDARVVHGRYGEIPRATAPVAPADWSDLLAGTEAEGLEAGEIRSEPVTVELPSGVRLRVRSWEETTLEGGGPGTRVLGPAFGGAFAIVPSDALASERETSGSLLSYFANLPGRLVTLVGCLVADPLHIPVTLLRIAWLLLGLGFLVAVFLPVSVLAGIASLFAPLFRIDEPLGTTRWIALSGLFVLLVGGAWFYATEGETLEDRAVSHLILPSPVETWNGLPSLLNQTWRRDLRGGTGWEDAARWARSTTVRPLGMALAPEEDDPRGSGAYVVRVQEKSRGQAAGFARRDLVTSVDGEAVTAEGFGELTDRLTSLESGASLRFEGVTEDGDPFERSLRVGTLVEPLGAEVTWQPATEERPAGAVVLKVFELSPVEQARLAIEGERREFRGFGLQPGAVVTAVDGEPLASTDDLIRRIEEVAAGEPSGEEPHRPVTVSGFTSDQQLMSARRERPFEAEVDLGEDVFSVQPGAIDWGAVESWHSVPQALLDAAMFEVIGPSWTDWTLLESTLRSLIRIILGFLWGVVLAVPLGILMGSFAKQRAFWNPVWLVGLYLPLPAMLPLSMTVFGTGETLAVAFLGVCTFVVLLPQVIAAIRDTPEVYRQTARTLGADRSQIVRKVFVDVSLADMVRGLRISFGVGWTWIILAEWVGFNSGLGYLIWTSQRRSFPERIYIVIAVIVLLGFLVNGLWKRTEAWAFPHREES